MAQSFFDWNDPEIPTLHVSFHLGCHYNSVRSIEDDLQGSALAFPVGHKLEMKDDDEIEEEKQEEDKKIASAAKLAAKGEKMTPDDLA